MPRRAGPGRRSRALRVGALALGLALPASRADAWRAVVAGAGSGAGEAVAAAVAADGDVVAAGHLAEDASGSAFAVVRLAGTDGSERWRRALLPGGGGVGAVRGARAVALDAAGDVLAVGTTRPAGTTAQTLTVVKLAGSSGAIAWRHDWPATDFALGLAVAVDEAGDVVAAGVVKRAGVFGNALGIVKLAGGDGAPRWAVELVGGPIPSVAAVAVLPGGDVLASGFAGDAGDPTATPVPVVVRLDGASGDEIWRSAGTSTCAARLAVSPGGDVFAAEGLCGDALPSGSPVLRRLAGATGVPVWVRPTPAAEALALDADGAPVVLATDYTFTARVFASGFRVLRVAAADGGLVGERAYSGDVLCTDACDRFGPGRGLAVAPGGDVLAVGDGTVDARLVTVRLAGADLREVWRRDDPHWHAVPGPFTARAAVAAGGRLILPGTVSAVPPGPVPFPGAAFAVLALDAAGGALDACGDAVTDAGEQCDDGLLAGGCCAPDCGAAAPDGAACDDFDACTVGDACAGATCRGTAPLPCAPCGTCDPRRGCVAAVAPVCKDPTVTNAATLVVRQQSGRQRLTWAMRSGPATAVAEFGDPRAQTEFALCAYAGGQVVARAVAPAGGCGGRACWRRTRRGFVYRNPRAPGGIARLALRAGEAGRTRLRVAARGPGLLAPVPPLPETSVLVQLRRSDDPAACWVADHGVVRTNRTDRFRATGD